jgi:hypothetical protein
LNHIWGTDLKPLDVELFSRSLSNGLSNKNPKSPLAFALSLKKTIRWGNKADPFQMAERVHHVSGEVLKILEGHRWSFVIQTMFTEVMMDYFDDIIRMKDLCTVQPIISPGAEDDWDVLERRRTTPVEDRIDHILLLKRNGVPVGVNGEPFIPGYHTVAQFRCLIHRLKSHGIVNYNTYSFHFNDFVAKRLHNIDIDIERIWYYNQDENWKPILQKLIDIAKKYGVNLGCPDFVNSGNYQELTNTCCGINVPNPTTFNLINFKRRILAGEDREEVFKSSWDGVGDKELGRRVFDGKEPGMYCLKDCGCGL